MCPSNTSPFPRFSSTTLLSCSLSGKPSVLYREEPINVIYLSMPLSWSVNSNSVKDKMLSLNQFDIVSNSIVPTDGGVVSMTNSSVETLVSSPAWSVARISHKENI